MKSKKKYPLKYEDCMNSVLIQEIMRYNLLLSLIFRNLDECVKAFMGHMPLTDEIEDIGLDDEQSDKMEVENKETKHHKKKGFRHKHGKNF